jgi:hypothetical protein
MRRNLFAIFTMAAVLSGVLAPIQSYAGPTASPGKSQGNGPCVTSGNTNSQAKSTKNTNKECLAAPAAPTIETVTVISDTTVSLPFIPGAANGSAITSYTITSSPSISLSHSGLTSPLTVTGSFVENQAYTFTMTATNAAGTSSSSAASNLVTPNPVVVYAVGDTGPGGGKIFYVAATPFTCGPTLAETCTYLEAAPTSGTNAWTDAIYVWSETDAGIGATAQGVEIGTGFKNTLAMIGQNSAGASGAGNVAQAFRGPNALSDWFLPSKDELNQMCKWARGQAWTSNATVCDNTGAINTGSGAAGFYSDYYWPSTEEGASNVWFQSFYDGFQYYGATKNFSFYVRPVRAF